MTRTQLGKIIAYLLLVVAVFNVPYLIMSFATMSFDPSTWGVVGRIIALLLVALFGAGAIALIVTSDSGK